MKAYIGAKIIQAEPMDLFTFTETQVPARSLGEGSENAPGYKVVYPDGYVSWSPKDAFEQAYREVSLGEVELIYGEEFITPGKMYPVVSSYIQAIGWEEGKLRVDINGATYEYDNVPREVFNNLLIARIPGEALAKKIKDRYPGRKVEA